MRYLPRPSTTVAPRGARTVEAGPTRVIRPFSMRTVWVGRAAEESSAARTSITVTPEIAIAPGAAGPEAGALQARAAAQSGGSFRQRTFTASLDPVPLDRLPHQMQVEPVDE